MNEPEKDRLKAWGDELRDVHDRLRKALSIAIESVESDAHPDSPRDLLIYCWGFCSALSGHHRSEDATLFPRIVAARPDLADTIAKLTQDHSMIEYLIGGLEGALSAGSPREEKLRHLEGIGAIMESHFAFEERQLIAVLNAEPDIGSERTELFGPIA